MAKKNEKKKSADGTPKVAPPWWAWVLGVACIAIAFVGTAMAPSHRVALSILGVGAGVTILQSSRLAKLPEKKRMAIAGVITAVAWIAFAVLLNFIE